MKTDFEKAFALFSECFDTDKHETEIILNFAKEHGQIFYKMKNGVLSNLICLCEISDGGLKADYLFGCCTRQEFRGQGIFKNHIAEVIGNKSAILIPEKKELFPFYERLGFLPITHLEVLTDGFNDFDDCEFDENKLFEIYKRSEIFPKKDFFTFSSTMNAFLHYGGRIKEKNGVFITVIGNEITEIFAESTSDVVLILKESKKGENRLLLPYRYKKLLIESNIEFSENTVAMAKNIKPSLIEKIYINNLFN